MVDTYLWGNVERISPEAPVPVISCSKQEDRLGGAANVALNIKALGATPILCGIKAKDEKGKILGSLLDEENLCQDGIATFSDRKTTSKTRIISNSQHLLRVDEETDELITLDQEKTFIQQILSLIEKLKPAAIIFEDYDKGAITPELITTIVKKANNQNIPVLADPKKRNFLSYKNISLFKPNLKEFREGLNKEIDKNNIEDLLKTASKFIKEIQTEKILLTLSDSGIFITNGETFKHIKAEPRDVIDVSGAGDTVIAVASLCLASGANDTDLAAISNIAGGLACEKLGVVPVYYDELLNKCLIKAE